MPHPHNIILVENLRKSFGARPVLNGIDLKIARANLTVFIGKSGCGKSTLLRCLNGLEIFDSGCIEINGHKFERSTTSAECDRSFQKKAQEIRKSVGMVFQSFNLFPHLTLMQNVIKAPMVVQNKSRDEAEALAFKLLEKVGLTEHRNHYPTQMSGGQQQRGAIARALALTPKIIL